METVRLTSGYSPRNRSPFGGIPRNWKLEPNGFKSFPMLSDTWLGVVFSACSPFGGIPRNWKLHLMRSYAAPGAQTVPPSGGSLEIGNLLCRLTSPTRHPGFVPPSGGSLEIGNIYYGTTGYTDSAWVPPSGGSLEIGNLNQAHLSVTKLNLFPLRGDP